MKEGEPPNKFHIQEERRLFYVALTRAEERLTVTTVTEKKNKVPVFIEDMLLDPSIKRRDILAAAPKFRIRLQSQAQADCFQCRCCSRVAGPTEKSFRVSQPGPNLFTRPHLNRSPSVLPASAVTAAVRNNFCSAICGH